MVDGLLTQGISGCDRSVCKRISDFSLSTFASLCLMSKALGGNSRPPQTMASLISLQLPQLGKNVAVAPVYGKTTRDKGEALPAGQSHLKLSGKDLAPGYFISDSLQSASPSLHSPNQRRDNISVPGRQLRLSATWLSPSYRPRYLPNRRVPGNLCPQFRLSLPFATQATPTREPISG